MTANGGLPPLKRQFDISEHPQLLPSLFLLRREPSKGFVFKLVGENIKKLFSCK
jgi:hypothetical protein